MAKNKMPSTGGSRLPAKSQTPVRREFGERSLVIDQVHHVRTLKPTSPGPWSTEADKIAWVDPATGLECIIRRERFGGHLCGYVAVPPGHPLFGFNHDAFPHSIDIAVHGGISYSKPCEGGPEQTSVCHVVEDEGRDLKWWFGFECDQPYDLVPNMPKRDQALAAEPVYRDEAYVLEQVTGLAAQLDAIDQGRPLSAVDAAHAPPIGRDRERAKP